MTSSRSRSLALAFGVLLLSCGTSDESAHSVTPNGAPEARAPQSQPTLTNQGHRAVELPEDFPKDVPVYSPSDLVEVLSGDGRQAISFTTEAGGQEVARFYREQLRDDGWNLEEAIEFGDQVMLSGSKDERQVSVFIMSRKGLTTVAVSISSS